MRLRSRGLWLSVGLTNHSSRRLRRGLTQALGLNPLQSLRPVRGPLSFLGLGHIGGSPCCPRVVVLVHRVHRARIGRGRGPVFQGGQSVAVAVFRFAGPCTLASPCLPSASPWLSVRPNHSFKPTAGDGRATSHASWAGGGLTRALGLQQRGPVVTARTRVSRPPLAPEQCTLAPPSHHAGHGLGCRIVLGENQLSGAPYRWRPVRPALGPRPSRACGHAVRGLALT